MRKLAKGLPRINLVGYKDPLEYQKSASIAILTSSYEGWGMVLTEAMQCGAVPVAFNSFESIGDIIDDGENGFLVKPFSTNQFVEKLRLLMSNEDLRLKMSNRATETVESFNVSRIVDKWEEVFHSIMSK